jgi:hypothetical protein
MPPPTTGGYRRRELLALDDHLLSLRDTYPSAIHADKLIQLF